MDPVVNTVNYMRVSGTYDMTLVSGIVSLLCADTKRSRGQMGLLMMKNANRDAFK